MGKKLTTTTFIERAGQIHGDIYDYSSTTYVSSAAKVTIICRVHGEFEQWPMDHLRGNGCRLCNERQRLTTVDFITRAAQIHHNKYDYSDAKYTNTYTKVNITCPEHGPFAQVAKDHLAGYGCPTCGGTGKKTTQEFILAARAAHRDTYDYSLVDLRSMNKKVKIICPDHGEFFQRPADHVNGVGCPTCGALKQGGYTYEYFSNHPDMKDISAKLYLIGVDAKYCKIGITTKQYIKQRFPGLRFVECACRDTTLYSAFVAEQHILHKFAADRYRVCDLQHTPYQTGWTECFPLSMVDELKIAVESIPHFQ